MLIEKLQRTKIKEPLIPSESCLSLARLGAYEYLCYEVFGCYGLSVLEVSKGHRSRLVEIPQSLHDVLDSEV